MKNHVVVGRIGARFGVKGWLKVNSYTHPAAQLLNYRPWLQERNGEWCPLNVTETKQQGSQLLVKLEGCNDPETAQQYTNLLIAVPRSVLPKAGQDEYYWNDLIGLTVINQNNETLGQVDHLLATGSNDVLVVKGQTEHLIPFLKTVVLNVDLEKGIIEVQF